MRRKTALYTSGVFLVCIVMIIGYFVFWKNKNVTVYNDKFKILDYNISKGSDHMIYSGNQTAGRVRIILYNRLGLKFVNLPWMVRMVTQTGRAFLMRYEGDFTFKELNGLTAVLTNGKNICEEMSGGNIPVPNEPTFVGCYILPVLPKSDDSFKIELRLKSDDDPIASLRVGKLYRQVKSNGSDTP